MSRTAGGSARTSSLSCECRSSYPIRWLPGSGRHAVVGREIESQIAHVAQREGFGDASHAGATLIATAHRLIETFLSWLGVYSARLIIIPAVVDHQAAMVRALAFEGCYDLGQNAAHEIVISHPIRTGIIRSCF